VYKIHFVSKQEFKCNCCLEGEKSWNLQGISFEHCSDWGQCCLACTYTNTWHKLAKAAASDFEPSIPTGLFEEKRLYNLLSNAPCDMKCGTRR